MKIKDIYVIKKDGTKQSFDGEKIVRAINASAKTDPYHALPCGGSLR